MTAERAYLPAAGRDWALPFYDPMTWLMGAHRSRAQLLAQASLGGRERVLDIGCGTGTFAIFLKRRCPDLHIVGLDPDPKALARARWKSDRAAISIQFDRGFSDQLPYAGASFDRVFSSFMFHHLPAESRLQTLQEVRRVLSPGGSLHLVDFERRESPHGLLARLHSSHHLQDSSENRILDLMRQAGFASAEKRAGGSVLFGLLPIGFYAALRN